MPSSIVKSISRDTGKSEEEVEALWKKAKVTVSKEYPQYSKDDDNYWKLVTSITKKMSEDTSDIMSFKQFIAEAQSDAPNYREADGNEKCSNCKFNNDGHCEKFDFDFKNGYTCDAWEPKE